MVAPARGETAAVEVDGRTIEVTNPAKVFFSARGDTKLDLVRYYIAVGAGALRGVLERPTVLKRFPNGAEGEFFYQKRVPEKRPEWLETVTVTFPSGRSAEELCPLDVAHIVWAVNLGCLDLNPWPVRRSDVDHPDELRVDLDPQPDVDFGRAAGGARGAGGPRRRGSRRLPEDLGLARHPRQRADPASLDLQRGAPGGGGARPRGGAEGAGHRHLGLVEGGARQPGLHRLQPERP